MTIKVFAAIFLGFLSSAFARTWTDVYGRKFEGKVIEVKGEEVLMNIGGRQRQLKLGSFSKQDQEFLRGGGKVVSEAPPRNTRRPVTRHTTEIHADLGTSVRRIENNPAEKRWVYASPHFEFICNDDLGLSVVREFVWMFESIWQFCGSWPFDIPRLRAQERVRMKTYLVESKEDYVRMGGMPGSAGVYLPSRDIILIPFESLGIMGSNGSYRINRKRNDYVLRHEITHQLMRGETQQAAWFIEGSAEYAATVPFQVTRLLLTHHEKAVVDYVIGFGRENMGGWNLGRALTLPKLETMMSASYSGFQRIKNSYPYGLLVFTYFMKYDGEGDGARLTRYVNQLQQGVPEKEARKVLLDGRTFEQLQKDFASAWNQRGIRINFR